MGPKITVDSSKLMNKASRDEAHELFGVARIDFDDIDVCAPTNRRTFDGPFTDGRRWRSCRCPTCAVMAYRVEIPIAHDVVRHAIDWTTLSRLDFELPISSISCLNLAYYEGRAGETRRLAQRGERGSSRSFLNGS